MNIVGEVMKRDEKIDMAHIPLKGAAPLKQELLAGRLQLGGDQLSSSLADIRKSSLKALATNAPQRLAVLPDVPTVRELGFPKLEADGWNGLFAPAKTPREIIERLQRETAAAVRHPDSAKRLTDLAAEPVGSTPAEQDAVLRRQVAREDRVKTHQQQRQQRCNRQDHLDSCSLQDASMLDGERDQQDRGSEYERRVDPQAQSARHPAQVHQCQLPRIHQRIRREQHVENVAACKA